MRFRLRLGACVTAVLAGLLLVGLAAGPALAWHANVTVTTRCLEGNVRVHYTVASWEKDHQATVDVSYTLNGQTRPLPSDVFGPHHNMFTGHFDLPNGTTGTITVTAVAHWEGGDVSTDQASDQLPDKSCEQASTTTEAPTPSEAPATTVVVTTTTEQAVLGATSTTAGGSALPFTGANTLPLLLAGLVLVAGGAVILLGSRARTNGRHAR